MRKIFSKMDKPLLFVSIVFFLFGLLMVLSASSMESYMRYGYGPYHYFYRQAIFMGFGLLIFFFVIRIPTKTYTFFSYLSMIGIIVVLGALGAYGYVANSAQSWFKIGEISIQPSEFAKVISVVFLGCYYGKNRDNLNNVRVLIFPLIPVILIFGMVLIQPDLGTALIIGLITCFMFFSLPMPRKRLGEFKLLVVGAIALVVFVYVVTGGKILKDYQKERFNFKDPCERYQEDSGYQLCNSFIAFKNGGLTGQGIGKSTQKYLYLPESYTDFIFPIIVEEWGAVAGVIIVLVYLFVIYLIQVILDVLLLSVIGFLLSKIIGVEFKYKSIFNMSVYSLTLSIVLYMIYIIVNLFTGFEIKYFEIAYNAIAYIYIITAMLMIKSDLIKQQGELTKIVQVQKKIREEKKEEDNKEEKEKKEEQKKDKKQEEKEDDKGEEQTPEGSKA